MSQPLILLLRQITSEQLLALKQTAQNYRVINYDQLDDSIDLDQVEVLFGWRPEIGEQLLASPTSKLKWIQAYSAGIDYFDLTLLRQKQILLTNASGVHATPITESVIGMLLSYYRRLNDSRLLQTNKKWQSKIPSRELAGSNMLIVGTGQIGQQLANVAKAFDINVSGVNRSGKQVANFQEIYLQSDIAKHIEQMDIVVNILPLTTETHHFYDAQLFQKMKDGVVFVNVGRGPSVDTQALIACCQTKKIGFAALDVFEEEPLPVSSELWNLDNVLITPHISGNTDQYDERLLRIFAENIHSFIKTQQLSRNLVDLTLGY